MKSAKELRDAFARIGLASNDCVLKSSAMRRAARFIVALVVGLALVTAVASVLVHRTTRSWFERDLKLRAQLAVNGVRNALLPHWSVEGQRALAIRLADLTHDERVMAAAACSRDFRMLASTAEFPDTITCGDFAQDMRTGPGASPSSWTPYTVVTALPGGNVYLSAIPVNDSGEAKGFVVLLQDLSFVERREDMTQQFLLIAFFVLALAASGMTFVASRLSWRSWSDELRRMIRGTEQRAQTQSTEFQPILRDVRELVDRLIAERENETEGGAWTPARLKHTLVKHLRGEKVVLLANREPYVHQFKHKEGNGHAEQEVEVIHPASGLVTALEPVMRACSGTWIAHGSGSADRATVDGNDRVRVPPGEESYALRRIWLTEEEEKGYYYGFANEGLWPLCHIAHTRPIFRSEDWKHYQVVNDRFAEAAAKETDTDDPIVLVQDYHFALAPKLIRKHMPDATVIMFWHIPWPNSQHFGICPWRKELLHGMLGASILGFHTQFDCNNFLDSVDRFLEARIDREQNAVILHGHRTLVRPYPIAIEWPNRWLEGIPSVADCRKSVIEELGLAADAMIGVGVDRLDYTKGLEERLLAVERMLERYPELVGRFTFVQLAAPSRTIIERYKVLNESVEQLTARINERFASGSYRPVILQRAHHEPPTVFRYYRAADLCYVSSLHDGMNLVAKEFVAAREDEGGVLVLSQFTGAARELTEALIVNPYDLEEASAALATAVHMSQQERRMRMRSMRSMLGELNVYRWAGRMLVDAARLRSRERLSGRLTDHFTPATGSPAIGVGGR
jgi:trehalose 6-phosphate synthase